MHYNWGSWKASVRDIGEDCACLKAAQAELLRIFGEGWPVHMRSEPRSANHLARAIIELELRRSESYCNKQLFLDFQGDDNPLGPSGLPDMPNPTFISDLFLILCPRTNTRILEQ